MHFCSYFTFILIKISLVKKHLKSFPSPFYLRMSVYVQAAHPSMKIPLAVVIIFTAYKFYKNTKQIAYEDLHTYLNVKY